MINSLLSKEYKYLHRIFTQFFKFGLVGFSSTLITFAIYYGLVLAGVYYQTANIISYTTGIFNGFYWQNKYVFNKGGQGYLQVFIKVLICYGTTFGVSIIVFYIIVDLIEFSKYMAPVLNLIIIVPLNFFMTKYWAYKDK